MRVDKETPGGHKPCKYIDHHVLATPNSIFHCKMMAINRLQSLVCTSLQSPILGLDAGKEGAALSGQDSAMPYRLARGTSAILEPSTPPPRGVLTQHATLPAFSI